MDTETMIRELSAVAEKHKNDFVPTCQTNITAMCEDMIPKLKQLKYYEDLKKQGKLLILPCEVEDTVYEICEGAIEPCTVKGIFLVDDKEGNPSSIMELHYNRKDCPYVSTDIYFTDIGKTVFLTREEAEKALKELEVSKES